MLNCWARNLPPGLHITGTTSLELLLVPVLVVFNNHLKMTGDVKQESWSGLPDYLKYRMYHSTELKSTSLVIKEDTAKVSPSYVEPKERGGSPFHKDPSVLLSPADNRRH